MRDIVLIAHNLRSSHNVGSLLRTAEGLGVGKIWLSGYSPYPQRENDQRLPHLAAKINRQITKTSLGAEKTTDWNYESDVTKIIGQLKVHSYVITALEQAVNSIKLPDYQPTDKIAIIVGREVEGLEPEVLALCDVVIEIPMLGQKESYNVAQAAAMALYHCRFTS